MSEQNTTVRTDELRPGDRVWHPFDVACFTVARKPDPVALDFEGERGLRVTGTDDRGETVYVDVSPAYKWHRGPKATAPTTHDPLVVNTKDGTCWTRRTVTSGGITLYAPERVKTCPGFVMATLEELAEQGIVGSAFALPVPVGPEPEPQKPGTFRFTLDIEGATDREDASWAAEQAVSAVEGQGYKAFTAVVDEDAHYRAAFEAQRSRAETLDRLLRTAQGRVAELESERHSTNEALSDAAEALRANRDRIAELEARLAEREQSAAGYPPALPWARLMDDEDLSDFLDELAAAAGTPGTFEGALATVENTIARWRAIGEAQHAHNTAPGPNAIEDQPGMRHAVRTETGGAS